MGLFAVLPLPPLPSVWEKVIIPWFSRFSLRKNVPFVLFMPQAQTKALSTQLWTETVRPPGGGWVSQPAWQGLAYVLMTEREWDGFGFTNTGRCCCCTGSLTSAPAALVHMKKVSWTRDLPSKGNKASSSLFLFLLEGGLGSAGVKKRLTQWRCHWIIFIQREVLLSVYSSKENNRSELGQVQMLPHSIFNNRDTTWVTALRAWARPRVVR